MHRGTKNVVEVITVESSLSSKVIKLSCAFTSATVMTAFPAKKISCAIRSPPFSCCSFGNYVGYISLHALALDDSNSARLNFGSKVNYISQQRIVRYSGRLKQLV